MEASAVRELRDWEAWILAAFAAVALFAPTHNAGTALLAASGVILIRVVAGATLHGTHPPPDSEFPGLTHDETLIAWHVFRGRSDPAISRRTALSLAKVRELETRIKHRWNVSSREEIAECVAQLLETPPRAPGSLPPVRTLLLDLIAALGVVALGVAVIAVPEETPLIGDIRDPLGLVLIAAGVVIAIVFVVTYLLDRRRH